MTKELEGSRQMMIKKQAEIDQLQNEVLPYCFLLRIKLLAALSAEIQPFP